MSVQFRHSVMSSSLRPHGLQHARILCPSPILPELAQTHVYPVGDAIQPSHPLSSPSLPAFNLSQHQGIRTRQACLLLLSLLLNILLKGLTKEVRHTHTHTYTYTHNSQTDCKGKSKTISISLFANDTILYVENLEKFTKKL